MTDPQIVLSAARILRSDPAEGKVKLAVQVVNKGSVPVHVWATPTNITYSTDTQTINVTLAHVKPLAGFEQTQHRRLPEELVVSPGKRRTLRIEFPDHLRALDFTKPGLAPAIIETPVGPIAAMNLDVAYASTPFQPLVTLSPSEYAAELSGHGSRITVRLPVKGREGNSRNAFSG